MEPRVVFFTGLDRCGKTSTRKRVAELSGEKFITFDRSYLDNLVYDEVLRKRIFEVSFINSYFNRFSQLPGQCIVFLDVDPKTTYKRAIKTEGIEYDLDLLEATRKSFLKYLRTAENAAIETIIIKPGNKTIDEVANEVLKKLKKGVSSLKKVKYNSIRNRKCIASKNKNKGE